MRTVLGLMMIASLGLVACVGGIDAPTPPGDDTGDDDGGDNGGVGGGGSGPAAAEAKQLFDDGVYPILATKCIACHNLNGPVGNVTGFVAPTAADGYITAVGFQAVVGDFTPTGSPILTRVTVEMHEALTYTTDEQAKITAWLGKELEARAGGGGGTGSGSDGTGTGGESPAALTIRLISEWSGCMTLENFQAANMVAWGNVNAGGGGNCKTCHSLGEYGHISSNVEQPFFDTISQDKYYMAQYFSVDVPNKQVVINDRSFTGVGEGITPHQQHPRFDPTDNNGYRALEDFYNLTMQAKQAAPNGVCGPSKILN